MRTFFFVLKYIEKKKSSSIMGNGRSRYESLPSRCAKESDYVSNPLAYQIVSYGRTHQAAVDNLRRRCEKDGLPDIEYVPETNRRKMHCGFARHPNKNKWLYNTVFLGRHTSTRQACAFFYWNPAIHGPFHTEDDDTT